MSDHSGYVIRLDLLKLAQEILDRQNDATQERLRMDWELTPDMPFPELPSATTEEVIAEARKLNEFVSQKS